MGMRSIKLLLIAATALVPELLPATEPRTHLPLSGSGACGVDLSHDGAKPLETHFRANREHRDTGRWHVLARHLGRPRIGTPMPVAEKTGFSVENLGERVDVLAVDLVQKAMWSGEPPADLDWRFPNTLQFGQVRFRGRWGSEACHIAFGGYIDERQLPPKDIHGPMGNGGPHVTLGYVWRDEERPHPWMHTGDELWLQAHAAVPTWRMRPGVGQSPVGQMSFWMFLANEQGQAMALVLSFFDSRGSPERCRILNDGNVWFASCPVDPRNNGFESPYLTNAGAVGAGFQKEPWSTPKLFRFRISYNNFAAMLDAMNARIERSISVSTVGRERHSEGREPWPEPMLENPRRAIDFFAQSQVTGESELAPAQGTGPEPPSTDPRDYRLMLASLAFEVPNRDWRDLEETFEAGFYGQRPLVLIHNPQGVVRSQ